MICPEKEYGELYVFVCKQCGFDKNIIHNINRGLVKCVKCNRVQYGLKNKKRVYSQ